MLDDISTTAPPLPLPVDDEETDRISAKFAALLTGAPRPAQDDTLTIDGFINAEVHARGGMGRVFVAYDPKLDRTVAIKALPVGLAPHEPDAGVPRREGKALAKIDHPNVVRVLEMVEHRGLDCLVLEHIDGLHLGDWLKSAPRGWKQILHMFLAAGEGLAAVHRAGLVHRDVKPANIVVGPGGAVKLIDFGLAMRPGTDGSRHPEDRAGTPRYMAPEQIHGHAVDARSDQFSFCVALYEALFQAHPYISSDLAPSLDQDSLDAHTEHATRRTIFEQIVEGTPRRPTRLPPGLPPTIVPALLRGLSSDPRLRHRSLAHLLAELRRDPRRTLRRVLVGITGVLAFTAGVYLAVRPETCRSLAEEEAQIWDGRREAIAARLAPFGDAPLASLDRAVVTLATAQAKACDAKIGGKYPDTQLARDVCLQTQETELTAVLREIERSDDARLARLAPNLSTLPTAEACDDLAQLRYNCTEDPASVVALADGNAALLAGDYVRGQSLAEAAVRKADVHGASGSQARAQILLGRTAYERGDWTRARYQFEKAFDLADKNACFKIASENYHWLVKLAAFDERIPLAQAEMYSRFHENRIADDDQAARADMLNNRALLAERRKGDLPRAEQLLDEAIKLRESEPDSSSDPADGGLEPSAPDLDGSIGQADSYLNLASVLIKRGELDKARVALDRADVRRAVAVGPSHPDQAKHLRNRALIALHDENYPEAISLLEKALERAKLGLGLDALGLGEIYLALVQAHDYQGDREAALVAARAAVDAYSRLAPDDMRRIDALGAVAQMLIDSDKFSDALPVLDAAEQVASAANGSPIHRGSVSFQRGEALNGLERHVDAEREVLAAIWRFDDADLRANHDVRAHAGLILGEALNAQGRWRVAAPAFEQAVEIWRASGANPERLAWARWGLAQSLCHLPDRRADARHAFDDALSAIPVIELDPTRHYEKQQELASMCRLR